MRARLVIKGRPQGRNEWFVVTDTYALTALPAALFAFCSRLDPARTSYRKNSATRPEQCAVWALSADEDLAQILRETAEEAGVDLVSECPRGVEELRLATDNALDHAMSVATDANATRAEMDAALAIYREASDALRDARIAEISRKIKGR